MNKATVNHKIEGFSLVDQHDAVITLEELLTHQYFVLYFYPKDNTPG